MINVAVLVAALIYLLPAFWNGAPFPNSDSLSYLRVGESAAQALHRKLDQSLFAEPSTLQAPPTPMEQTKLKMGSTYLGSRSVFYGLPAYVLISVGGFWAVAATQAILAAVATRIILMTAVPGSGAGIIILTATTMTTATPFAFFVCNIMPDLFIGLASVSAATLIAWPQRLTTRSYAFLVGIIAFGVTVHTTHGIILIAAVLIGLATVSAFRHRLPLREAGVVLGIVGIALAGFLGSKLLSEAVLGKDLLNPPFLMARVVADGPGHRYLKNACQHQSLEMCRYMDRPLGDSQTILWDPDPKTGVFWPANYDQRIRLIREQNKIVVGTLEDYPLGVLQATSKNVLSLATSMRLAAELNWNMPAAIYEGFDHYWPGTARAYVTSEAYRNEFPFKLVDSWFASVALVSALSLVGSFAYFLARRRQQADPRDLSFICVILGAMLANLVLCAAASGPFDRYEARMIWLLPIAAAASATNAFGKRTSQRTASASATSFRFF